MPIDKSQSAQGLRYVEIYGSIRQCGPDIPVQDWESESGWLGWSTECDSSCQNHPWKKDERHDYEVDSEGRLIRLGNQIEEELFPATGLAFHSAGGWAGLMTRDAITGEDRTVAMVEKLDHFSHWADTPRNRELGLFKDEVDCSSLHAEESCVPYAERRQKIKGMRLTTWVHTPCRCCMYEILDAEVAEQLGMWVGDVWCPQCSPRPGEKEGEETMSDKEFKPFTNSDFREAIRGHENEKDVYFVVSVRQWDMRCDKETNNDGHTTVIGYKLKHDCGSDRSVGINDIVVCTPDREICTYHRGCTEKEYSYQATPLTDEQLRKVSSDLDAELHKKMVKTQNRSLAAAEVFEKTSWIKAKLPDGRIVESPLPKVKDGWEETWSDRWREDEAMLGRSLRWEEEIKANRDYYYMSNKWAAREGAIDELPVTDDMGLCWFSEMSQQLTSEWMTGPLQKKWPCVLEAKKFRRKKPTKDSRGTWADTGDREDSFLVHMQREFKAKRYRTDDWPERHVSGPLKWEK